MQSPLVITGMGMISPLGCGVKAGWERLLAGRSGLAPITRFDTGDLPIKVAGSVPDIANDTEAGFDPQFTYLSRTWRSALDAVAAGLCVSVAPLPIAEARAESDPRVRIAHVVDSPLTAESWISRRADTSSQLFDRVEQAVIDVFR